MFFGCEMSSDREVVVKSILYNEWAGSAVAHALWRARTLAKCLALPQQVKLATYTAFCIKKLCEKI